MAEIDRLLRPRLRRYFALGPWPSDEAEDLVQKALARVYLHVDQIQEPERFLGWLFAIARNVRISAQREWGARRRVEANPLDPEAENPAADRTEGIEDASIVRERWAAVERAILRLSSRQRQCLLLRLREEMSYDEIAEVLALSPRTVRNHIAQAKGNLRRLFADERRPPK